MKLFACTCPRCFFFLLAANDLAEMGDLDGALRAAAEVTVFEENPSDSAYYSDTWSPAADSDSVDLN